MTAYIRYGRWLHAMLGLAIALSLTGPTSAREVQQLQDLDRQVVGLIRAGKKADAAVIARKAVEVAESTHGAASLAAAQQLDNLALVLRMDRKYAEAEPLVKRALAIREAEFGMQHPDICQSLSNLAILYESAGRLADVEPLLRRSLTIREQAWGGEHPAVGQSLHELAKLYRQMGRTQEGDTFFKRAVAILGSGHPAVALDAIARGDFEAAALMLIVGDQSDPRAAVRRTFFGQVTELRWAGLRMTGEGPTETMVLQGEAMHGNNIWQPFEVSMTVQDGIWRMNLIRTLPMAWF